MGLPRMVRYLSITTSQKEIFMERRKFIHGAGLAGVIAAGTAPAVVQAQANIRWRLASSFPKSLDTIFGAAEDMSKIVSASTGGKSSKASSLGNRSCR